MKLFKIVTVFMVLLSTLKGYSQSEGYGTEYSHYKAKGAFEGVWKYDFNETKFIVRLKCLYIIATNGDTLTNVLGTFDLYKNGQKIVFYSQLRDKYKINSDSLMLTIAETSDFKQLSRENIFSFPIWGGISEKDNYFIIYENIPFKHFRNSLPFNIEVSSFSWSNTALLWDLWSEGIGLKRHIIMDFDPKPGDFTIPEKCTLTRISHDPMYGL